MSEQEYHGACAQKSKVCKTCLQEKPLSEFYPHKTGKFGRQAHCKSCRNRQDREARADAVAPTQADLRRLFRYDGEQLFWRERPSRRVDMSRPAGGITGNGYRMIKVKEKSYLAHRLIWLYVHGNWPLHQIDHINHERDDNRIENLRDTKENDRNRSPYKNNSSGVVGVVWHKRRKKWRAQIRVNGKMVHLGDFKSKEEAAQVRKEAVRKYGFHPNHGC